MIAKNLSEWRKLVLEKDNHTCQLCGDLSNIADHILAKELDNSLLLDIDNGRALCGSCHAKYGTKVFKIRDVIMSNGDDIKKPIYTPHVIDWDTNLEPQFLTMAGKIRTAADLSGKLLNDYIDDKLVVVRLTKTGCGMRIYDTKDTSIIETQNEPK